MHDTLTTQPEQAVADLGKSPFDSIRRFREDGSEFWSARDLMGLLGYAKWERFQETLNRAKFSAQIEAEAFPGAGKTLDNDFPGAGKIVSLGAGGSREVEDVHLSRFACYLVAMNGDSRKPEVAAAHRYFAIRTRQAELAEKVAHQMEIQRLREDAVVTSRRLDALESMTESQQTQLTRLAERISECDPESLDFDATLLHGRTLDRAVYWFLERFARRRPTGGWETTVTEIVRGIRAEHAGAHGRQEIEEVLTDLGYRQGRWRQALGATWFRLSTRPAPSF
jgi:hypothetical protein